MTKAPKNWFAEKRIEWITEALGIFGFINRTHLQSKFGVSNAQAALDFKLFNERYPGAMTYDSSQKRYVATKGA